jgi:hypothetical protein
MNLEKIKSYALLMTALIVLGLGLIISCTDNHESPGIVNPYIKGLTSSEDSIPPQQINDAHFEYDGDLVLHWTAPYDDELNDPVAAYEIRYLYSFFDSAFFWERAETIPDPPYPPSLPCSLEQYTFLEPIRGKKISAAIKSVDSSGNYSELSNIASFEIPGHTFHGRCLVFYAQYRPVPDLSVEVEINTPDYTVYEILTTDNNGEFHVDDLPSGFTLYLTITDGQSEIDYCTMVPTYELNTDYDEEFIMIRAEYMQSAYYQDWTVLEFTRTLYHCRFNGICGKPINCNVQYTCSEYQDCEVSNYYLVRRWQSVPIDIYFPDNFKSHFAEEWDEILDGVAMWNNVWQDSFSVNLFNIVESEPDVGILFAVHPGGQGGSNCRCETGPQGHPLRDVIKIYVPSTLVVAHEMGHSLPWGHCGMAIHSMDPNHLMHSPTISPLSEDEIKAAVLLYRLPDGFDLTMYGIQIP